MGPLTHRCFSVVNTTVLHGHNRLNSMMSIQRVDYKLYVDFWLCRGLVPLPPVLIKGQLYGFSYRFPKGKSRKRWGVSSKAKSCCVNGESPSFESM